MYLEPPYLLREKQPGKPPTDVELDLDWDPLESDTGSGKRLVCSACGHTITTSDARMLVEGTHAHTFFNPYGHVFEIGCFTFAPGCELEGPSITKFSWFPGYAWRVALCKGCGDLMGWQYISDGSNGFFGLILTHLREEDDGETGPT